MEKSHLINGNGNGKELKFNGNEPLGRIFTITQACYGTHKIALESIRTLKNAYGGLETLDFRTLWDSILSLEWCVTLR